MEATAASTVILDLASAGEIILKVMVLVEPYGRTTTSLDIDIY